MKKQVLFLTLMAVISAFTILSCEKVKDKILQMFSVEGANFAFSIPVINSTAETSLGVSEVDFNVDSIVRANTNHLFTLDDIDQVVAEKVTLTLSNPNQANNLANFESLKVQMSTQGGGNPVIVASIALPDTYAETISLTPEQSQQLLNLMKTSSIPKVRYEVFGKARRVTTQVLAAQLVVKLKFK